MRHKIGIILLALLGVCGCATAQITLVQNDHVVVSDVDDTIKTINVRNSSNTEIIKNGLKSNNSFWGMAQLYTSLKTKINGLEFIYLSGSTSLASSYYTDFLNQSGFPKGSLVQKTNFFESTKTYKIRKIQEIIKNKKPKFLYFVGDNGEYDPDVIVEIKKLYPNIRHYSFIRYVYSGKRQDESYYKYFATHLDIAWSLFQDNVFNSTDMLQIVEQTNLQFEQEKGKEQEHPDQPALFAKWVDCKGFAADWYANVNMLNGLSETYSYYIARCPMNLPNVALVLE